MARTLGFLLLLVVGSVVAHEVGAPSEDPSGPWVPITLALTAGLYGRGLLTLWQHAGPGRGVTRMQAGSFGAGLLLLAAALLSPLDAVAARSFAAHMVQHEVLMAIAAPLLVLGRPLVAFAWMLPRQRRLRLPALLHSGAVSRTWAALTAPLAAFSLHAATVWGWHLPVLFEAALHSEAVHVLQHLTFLGTALLFWWNALAAGSRVARGSALLALFLTMLHTSLLGALLTFSSHPWYPSYAHAATGHAFDPLADQQLGGLVMWVPGGVSYLLAALFIAARWLAPYSPRRA